MEVERSAINRTSSVAPTVKAQRIVQKGAGKNLKARGRGRKLFSGHRMPVTLLNSQYGYKNVSRILRTYIGAQYLFKHNKNENKEAVIILLGIKHLQISVTC